MKVVVSGSRDIHDYNLLLDAIRESGFVPTCMVHGGAAGVDTLAQRYAKANGIPFVEFPADWNTHKRAAGPIRNSQMIESVAGQPAGFIAIWDGKSRGTFDCIKKAFAAGLPVYVKQPPALRT